MSSICSAKLSRVEELTWSARKYRNQIVFKINIVEESFYRKNLISFKNRRILVLTTLFSMFLYALEHALAIWGIFLCMIWALPLSISYIKTKNIYVVMTAHFICNIVVNGMAIVKLCFFLLHWQLRLVWWNRSNKWLIKRIYL